MTVLSTAGRAWAAGSADLADLEWLAEAEPTTQVPGQTWALNKDDVPTLVAALPEDHEGWFEPFVDGAVEVWTAVAPLVYEDAAVLV